MSSTLISSGFSFSALQYILFSGSRGVQHCLLLQHTCPLASCHAEPSGSVVESCDKMWITSPIVVLSQQNQVLLGCFPFDNIGKSRFQRRNTRLSNCHYKGVVVRVSSKGGVRLEHVIQFVVCRSDPEVLHLEQCVLPRQARLSKGSREARAGRLHPGRTCSWSASHGHPGRASPASAICPEFGCDAFRIGKDGIQCLEFRCDNIGMNATFRRMWSARA